MAHNKVRVEVGSNGEVRLVDLSSTKPVLLKKVQYFSWETAWDALDPTKEWHWTYRDNNSIEDTRAMTAVDLIWHFSENLGCSNWALFQDVKSLPEAVEKLLRMKTQEYKPTGRLVKVAYRDRLEWGDRECGGLSYEPEPVFWFPEAPKTAKKRSYTLYAFGKKLPGKIWGKLSAAANSRSVAYSDNWTGATLAAKKGEALLTDFEVIEIAKVFGIEVMEAAGLQ